MNPLHCIVIRAPALLPLKAALPVVARILDEASPAHDRIFVTDGGPIDNLIARQATAKGFKVLVIATRYDRFGEEAPVIRTRALTTHGPRHWYVLMAEGQPEMNRPVIAEADFAIQKGIPVSYIRVNLRFEASHERRRASMG